MSGRSGLTVTRLRDGLQGGVGASLQATIDEARFFPQP